MPNPFWLIGTGDKSNPLDESLAAFISEVRVEEKLSKPTRYAIRFEESVCKGAFQVAGSELLRPGRTLSVLVKEKTEDEVLACLVRGPITKIRTSAVAVADTQFYEVHGEDERVLLARQSIQAEEVGLASDALQGVLEDVAVDTDVEVETTPIQYTEEMKLTHNGSVLSFVEKVARENIMEFWISYSPVEDGEPVKPTFNVKASPPRPSAGGGPVPFPPPLPVLSAEAGKTLLVSAPSDECPNVLSFDIDVDIERASLAFFDLLDDDANIRREEVSDEQPALGDGERLGGIDAATRVQSRRQGGNPQEDALRAQAERIEAGWFVTATASTALFTLGFLPRPHQVVSVEGIGEQYSGAFQVFETIHVLNGSGVLTDSKLRRNTLNLTAAAGGLPGGLNV